MASSQWSIVVMNRTGSFSRSARDGSNLGLEAVERLETNGSYLAIPDWDEWDETLWTPEQRQLIEQGTVPRQVYVSLGVLLSLVVIFGLVANATILYVFSRFKRLRTPANVFIINLTACDFISCLIHPMAVYSAFRGRWSFGKTGCNFYATCIGFFGLNSIVTLSAIACERYVVITSSSCRPAVAKWRITRCQAQKACFGIWLHCAALVAPPWLFGWSAYQPEGVLITCSWDYSSRTLSNRLYYVYLLVLGFVLPVSVLTFCYSAIFRFIVRSSREMTRLIMTSDGTASFSKTTMSFRKRRRQTDVRTALIILSLALLCFTAWTPYAIVSLIGQFGPLDENDESGQLKLSPLTTSIPAFLAKTAIVFDPLVYGFSHPQFRSSVRTILQQYSMESSNNGAARGGGMQKNNNGTTFMMVTAGMRHPRRGRHSNSPGTSSAAVSWVKRSGDGNKAINEAAAQRNGAMSTPKAKLKSAETIRAANLWNHPKRAMSLGTIMWRKRTSAKSGLVNGRVGVSRSTTDTERSAAILRSKGDAFYLLRGQHRSAYQEPWVVKENVIQLLTGATTTTTACRATSKTSAQQQQKRISSPLRRSSEPDMMRYSTRTATNNVSTLSCDRRRKSDYIRSVLFNSFTHLPGRQQQEPMLVIVSLPDDGGHIKPSASLSVPAIDYNHLMCGQNNRTSCGRNKHLRRETRSTDNSPSLSIRSAATNHHQFWTNKHQHYSDGYQCAHRPLSHPLAWRIDERKEGHNNSYSCPLIAPR